MSITNDEAVRIGRAYSMSLTDVETLIRMAGDVEEAKHIAIQFGGTANERADEAHKVARKKSDADQAVEHQKFTEYQAAHPKPPVAKWKPVEADLRPGMSDGERARAIGEAHEANTRGEAQARSGEAQQRSKDYYDWKAQGAATEGGTVATESGAA